MMLLPHEVRRILKRCDQYCVAQSCVNLTLLASFEMGSGRAGVQRMHVGSMLAHTLQRSFSNLKVKGVVSHILRQHDPLTHVVRRILKILK